MTEWISVNERMPVESETCAGRVAVLGDTGYANVGLVVGQKLISVEECVTHWMPLPAPPTTSDGNQK